MKKPNTFKRLFSYVGKNKKSVVAIIFFAIISTYFMVFAPKLLGEVTTKLYEGVTTGTFDINGIVILLLCVIALYIVSQLFAVFQNFSIAKLTSKMVQKIRNDVNQKMHNMKINYYDTHTHGEVLSTITNDVETLNTTMTQDLPQALPMIFKAIGIIAMAFSINAMLALIVLAIVPVSILVGNGILLASTKSFSEQQDLLGELNGIIEENYTGQTVVQSFNYQKRAVSIFEKFNNKLQKVSQKALSSSGSLIPVTNLVSNVGYIVIAVIGCNMAISGNISIGDVQALLQYAKELSEPIQSIAGMMGSFASASAASKRIFKLLDEEEEIPDPKDPIVPETNTGTVEFQHVAFGYLPNKLLMKDVSIKVKSGQKVAVVGPTGAGKTTLINLLMRFYEINSGKILVDGVDTSKMTREELRKRFGMVLQDTWLFEGTIMDNLKYGGENISDETVYKASKTACTDNFIKTFPNGYNMMLGKGAENVSQGERQMLTIARAMATTPEIMILDEATSNVDTHTELVIQDAMKKLMQGRTSFVIAHRLSTIKDSDIILYMEQGDIKEAGSHDELMELNGKYATLYNSQFQ